MTFPSPTGPSQVTQSLRREVLREASGRRATKKLQQGIRRMAGNYPLAPIDTVRHLGFTKKDQ